VSDPAAVCARIVRESRSSFAAAFRFLPRRRRRAMNAVYAFCRRTDDIADGDGSHEEKAEALQAWRAQLTEHGEDPVIRAVVSAIAAFNIHPSHLHAVIDGCEMDLEKTRYASNEELEEYCSLVAGAVGHQCLGVWGLHGPEAGELAERLGLAVQLTNIIRDWREDAARGRIYIPRDLMRAVGPSGVSEEEILRGQTTENIRHCLRDMTARAGKAYGQAENIIADLPRREKKRLWPALIILGVYRRLLQRIHRLDYPDEPVRLRIGKLHALWIALRATLRSRFG
jgi:15-cis-phytoene synthase